MKLIDRIALNRLLNILAGLIISLAKIFTNKTSEDQDLKQPKRRKKFVDKILSPWRKNDE